MPQYARVSFNRNASPEQQERDLTVIVQDADAPKLDAIVREVANTSNPDNRFAPPVMVETQNTGNPAWLLQSRTIRTVSLIDG